MEANKLSFQHINLTSQPLSRVLNLGLPWAYPNICTEGKKLNHLLTDSKTNSELLPLTQINCQPGLVNSSVLQTTIVVQNS